MDVARPAFMCAKNIWTITTEIQSYEKIMEAAHWTHLLVSLPHERFFHRVRVALGQKAKGNEDAEANLRLVPGIENASLQGGE